MRWLVLVLALVVAELAAVTSVPLSRDEQLGYDVVQPTLPRSSLGQSRYYNPPGTVVEAEENCCHQSACAPCCHGGQGGCWVRPLEVPKGTDQAKVVPAGKLGTPSAAVQQKWQMRIVPTGMIGKAPNGAIPPPVRARTSRSLVRELRREKKLAKQHAVAKDITAIMKSRWGKAAKSLTGDDIAQMTASLQQPVSDPTEAFAEPPELTAKEKENMRNARDNIDKCIELSREGRSRKRRTVHECKRINKDPTKCLADEEVKWNGWLVKYKAQCEGSEAQNWYKAAHYDCDKLRAGVVMHAETYKKRCGAIKDKDVSKTCFHDYRSATQRWYDRMEMACRADPGYAYLHTVAKAYPLPVATVSKGPKPPLIMDLPPKSLSLQFCIGAGITIPNYVKELPGVGDQLKLLEPCPPGVSMCIPKLLKDKYFKQIPQGAVPAELRAALSAPDCPQ